VQGRQRPAAQGAVPADTDGGPLQPPAQGVLRATGRGREAEDAGRRRVHAQAGHALLRGPQEPRPVRPRVGLKKGRLTTRYLVRRLDYSFAWIPRAWLSGPATAFLRQRRIPKLPSPIRISSEDQDSQLGSDSIVYPASSWPPTTCRWSRR